MSIDKQSVGIIGAGKLSLALARRLLASGVEVRISSTRPVEDLEWILDVLAPGANAASTPELISASDVVVLALPLSKLSQLNPELFVGKVVVDAMNHWFAVDGSLAALDEFSGTSSELVAAMLPGAQVIKAFNHVGYHELEDLALPANSSERIGMAVAGNDPQAVAQVSALVNLAGFDPVYLGSLAESGPLDSGNQLFGATLPATELRNQFHAALANATHVRAQPINESESAA